MTICKCGATDARVYRGAEDPLCGPCAIKGGARVCETCGAPWGADSLVLDEFSGTELCPDCYARLLVEVLEDF